MTISLLFRRLKNKAYIQNLFSFSLLNSCLIYLRWLLWPDKRHYRRQTMLDSVRILTTALAVACYPAAPALAQAYPDKPVKMYVGFSPGSATDIVARVVSEALARRLGQPIVVENKVGAGGSLAAQDTVRAAPDGYTLLTVSSAIAVNPAVYKNASEVAGQLQPVALIGYLPTVLMVSGKSGIKTLRDFIEHAKAKPGEVNFGSS